MVAKRDTDAAVMVPPAEGIMELSFLISSTQFAALEQAAQTARMTVAQYLRRLVQCSLPSTCPSLSASEGRS